ncbi:MAG: DUF3298 domain-containing protein [Chlamydiae bacterium]|nr:DUF3298 domain-containing protein [Chlamydiota bacterium]
MKKYFYLLILTVCLNSGCSGKGVKTETLSLEKTADSTKIMLSKKYHLVSQEREERTESYSLKVVFPVLVGPQGRKTQRFNNGINVKILKFINQFKSSLNDVKETQSLSTLEIKYEVMNAQSHFLSLLFRADLYNAGAIHPNHDSFSMNYDLKKAKVLSLKDIFKNPDQGLKKISEYCEKKLLKKKGMPQDMVKKGTAPQFRNYKSWNWVSKGLKVIFAPYQVAPYAMGFQEVTIPLKLFREDVKEEYIVPGKEKKPHENDP